MKTLPGSHSVARLVGSAALIALFAGATGSASAQVATTKQAIMVSDQWSTWVNQADVLQSAMPTGGMGAQVTIHATSLGTPLISQISAAAEGRPVTTKLQLATFSYNLAPMSALNVGSTRITEIGLPGGDAANAGIPVFTVKFAQGIAEQGKPAIGTPPAVPITQGLRLNHFMLAFDNLPATMTRTIAPMTITLGARVPDLVITTSPPSTTASYQAWAKGLQAWFQSRLPRGGTLIYLGPDMSTPMFYEHFTGVVVKSIDTPTGAPATVTFALTGISVQAGKMSF